jgi:hypothetical protein
VVRNFPLLSEEGWTRHPQNIAKPPFWSGRGGAQSPQNFVEVEHHLLLAARYRACIRSAHPRLRELRMLRGIFLIAQPPLLGEEGKFATPPFGATAPIGRGPDTATRKPFGNENHGLSAVAN